MKLREWMEDEIGASLAGRLMYCVVAVALAIVVERDVPGGVWIVVLGAVLTGAAIRGADRADERIHHLEQQVQNLQRDRHQ